MVDMDLYDVMRTTAAVREFTAEQARWLGPVLASALRITITEEDS